MRRIFFLLSCVWLAFQAPADTPVARAVDPDALNFSRQASVNYEVTLPVPAKVFFSPRGGCEAAVVSAIAGAKTEVRVQCYSFSSLPIIKALAAAHARGVDVKVMLDKVWNTKAPQGANALRLAGVPVVLDGKHPIAHNKVCIVDQLTVITGSFNYTAQAEKYNAENLVVLTDPAIAARYLDQWSDHAAHAAP
jgi:phosphatidylserine/phosphatidylglycerophosphate/cardiolipin synthase-like enzyme